MGLYIGHWLSRGVFRGGSNKVHSGELGICPNTGRTRQTRAEGVGLRARVLSGAHTPSKQANRDRDRDRDFQVLLAVVTDQVRVVLR